MSLFIFFGKLSKMGYAISVRCVVPELLFGFMLFFIIANIAMSAMCIYRTLQNRDISVETIYRQAFRHFFFFLLHIS